MIRYLYTAIDQSGSQQRGEIVGPSRSAAVEKLQQQGLIPSELYEAKKSRFTFDVFGSVTRFARPRMNGDALKARDLMLMTQSLAALLNAGLTVDRALWVAAQLNADAKMSAVLSALAKAVRAGSTFADALSASGLSFPPYYVSMVQAGEVGGSLAQTMTRVGALLRRQLDVRERIRSALIYPGLLAAVVLLTLVLLIGFVLPRFEALFAESEATLPWSTQAVLVIGNVVSRYWWLIAVCGVPALLSVSRYISSAQGKRRVHRWMLTTRWLFGLPAAIDTARMLQTLSTLVANGVPLTRGLRLARGTLVNIVLQSALDDVAQRVKEGESVSVALGAAGVFPPHAIHLARVGEETGRLEEMLREAGDFLDQESQRGLERLLTLLVPVITIAMGLLVAGLIGSVLVGLLSINELTY